MRRFPASLVLLPLSVLLSVTPGFADEVVNTGGEFQVNTFTTGFQAYPRIAMSPQGGFLVVWFGAGSPDPFGIYGQLYAADGTPVGTELNISSTITAVQVFPSVAADGQGNFVVTWDSLFQDGDGFGVFAQRLDSTGASIGGEFQVNSYTTDSQYYNSVAAAADGSFLVVWESAQQDFSNAGVFGQLFDSTGAAVGGELQVNTTFDGNQYNARAAATADGFVVTWQSDLVDGNNVGVAMQMLDANAAFVGGETVVNTFTFGDQGYPTIAVGADGSFAITWTDSVQEGNGNAVYGQVYDSGGLAVGTEFRLNTYTTGDQENPRVAADGAGGFVAVWESAYQVDGTQNEDIFAQRFDTAGQPVGGEFQVNTQASYDQEYPEIAGGAGGGFVVVWHSNANLDGSAVGVFGQSFAVAIFADGFESGDTTAWSSSNP